jgi:hypothetical protein
MAYFAIEIWVSSESIICQGIFIFSIDKEI